MSIAIEKFINGVFTVDCREGMKNMPENSVDSIITDPPYGLEFMGRDWDRGVPGVGFWVEALRVSKPGAILLAFGGTRTYHRLVCAIEDAGWEIRDCMMWLYGTGFPKSHDISKAIDKELGVARTQVRHEAKVIRNPKSILSGHGVDGGDRPWMREAKEKGFYEKDGNVPATDQSERNSNLPEELKNDHPTVKPLMLMEYLCTLTRTPTGGIVLDPFCGSGSTLVAAQNTGRSFVGFDLAPEYVKISKGRLGQLKEVA